MTMRVSELAKELNISSKELIEKAATVGISVKGHQSGLSDENIVLIKNTLAAKEKNTETKIVKIKPKKSEKSKAEEGEPRVTVKAANIKPPVGKAKPKTQAKNREPENITRKPPVGKPVISKDLENRPKPPKGKPVPLKKIEEDPVKKAKAEKIQEIEKKAVPVPKDITDKKKAEKAVEMAEQLEKKAAQEEKKPIEEALVAEEKKAAPEKAKTLEKKAVPAVKKPASEEKKAAPAADKAKPADKKPAPPRKSKPEAERTKREPAADDGSRRDDRRKPKSSAKSEGKAGGRYKKADKYEDRGRKDRKPAPPRSLEKQVRPKKHQNKPKPAPQPEVEVQELPAGTKVINVPITVAGFAEQVDVSVSSVIMTLMKLGIMANINQNIDEDTLLILAAEMGIEVVIGKVEEEVVEEGLETFKDDEKDLVTRPPIITVMGHVDHGKTSLLDAIRKTHVTASESGGITQHIGASEVEINGQKIVFLDTPGHEAFTAMRARGAHITDIAVLVVAADDSVKPQTVESISHAKAAGVPIIVAINKMDKPGANPDNVKKDLADHNVLVEDWGGDVICVPVSAKTGDGIVSLLEMILLQAEVLELKANPDRLAMGTVVEARLDKAKGPVATLLVLNGTLKSGMSVVAGTCAGRIRLMTNHKGDTIRKATPATAVEILGLTDVPHAGDEFNAVKEDRIAREIAEHRKSKQREEVMATTSSTTLEELFSQIQEGEVKELNLIVKGDVQGSVGAVTTSLEKLKNENVRVKIIHTGVGAVTESDVMLAGTSGAVIIGFNVRPSSTVTAMADRESVQIRTYRVIYDIIDDVENAMKGMLDPEFKEVVLGKVELRETFKVPGIGMIGGAYVTEGKVVRNAKIRLVRDGIVIHEGKISSLKRFKDDAKEVNQGYECGIGIENYNDVKVGDIIECFQMEEIER